MTAAFLLRRFDDLDRLRDLGCRIAYPHARRKNEEHIAYEEQTRNLYISGLDLVCGLIANIGETEQKDMKKIQKAVKKDFENYSEQYKESFLNCIMDFIDQYPYNDRKEDIWEKIREYYPWMANALLTSENSNLRHYQFIREWLVFNKDV